jgi:hypothetical protein
MMMKKIVFALMFAALAACAETPVIILIPWASNPTNSADYSRTNTPAWYDGGTNFLGWNGSTDFSTNIFNWMAWQATMENFRRLTNWIGTNSASMTTLSNAAPAYVSIAGEARFATLSVWSGPQFTLDTNGNLTARSAIIGAGGTSIIELYSDGSAAFGNSTAVIETGGNVRAEEFSGINNGPAIFNNGITISAPMTFPATNSPSPGDALRWDGTHFYWGP